MANENRPGVYSGPVSWVLLIYLVYDAVGFGFFSVHEEVAVGVLLNARERLLGSLGEHLVEAIAGFQDMSGRNLNV